MMRILIALCGIILAITAWNLVLHARLSAARADVDVARLQTQVAQLIGAEWQAATGTLTGSLATCQSQWQDVTTRAATALAQAERQRLAARAVADQWRVRWDARATDCSAALAALDVPCAALEGY